MKIAGIDVPDISPRGSSTSLGRSSQTLWVAFQDYLDLEVIEVVLFKPCLGDPVEEESELLETNYLGEECYETEAEEEDPVVEPEKLIPVKEDLEAVGMVEATKTEGQALQDEGEEREEAEPAPGGDEVDEQCLDEDDVMEEAAVVLEMLALEEEQYALEYEELQLIELLAKERAQEPLKGGHDRRPPATPCTSVSMPPVHELAVKGSLFWQGSSRCGLGC